MNKPILIAMLVALLGWSPFGWAQDSDSTSQTDEQLHEYLGEDSSADEELARPPLEAPYVDVESETLPKKTVKKVRRVRRKQPEINPENLKGEGRIRKTYIEHPNAKKGLFRITQDGTYLYKVNPSEQKSTSSFRMGIYSAPDFINTDNNASFNDIYGGNDLMMLLDYEWSLAGFMPNLSLKLGSGLLFASGKGRLEDGQESLEEFTFLMFPNHASLSYKFKYFKKQWMYPYVEGGVGAFVFTERRDDNKPVLGRWGVGLNVHAVGGLAFAMSSISRDAILRLDSEYGVNEVWFTVDIRQIIGFGNFDMTSTMFNGGFTVDF